MKAPHNSVYFQTKLTRLLRYDTRLPILLWWRVAGLWSIAGLWGIARLWLSRWRISLLILGLRHVHCTTLVEICLHCEDDQVLRMLHGKPIMLCAILCSLQICQIT